MPLHEIDTNQTSKYIITTSRGINAGDEIHLRAGVILDVTENPDPRFNGMGFVRASDGGHHILTIDGTVKAQQYGINLRWLEDGKQDFITIGSSGKILCSLGNAIEVERGTVSNAGSIDGRVFSWGALTLTNTGNNEAMAGSGDPSAVSAKGQLNVTNSGFIKGHSYGIKTLGNFDDVVTNTGNISSNGQAISLDLGNDKYDGRGGFVTNLDGTAAGTISMGAGQDTVYGGAGQENIFGEAGDDTLEGGGGNDIIDGGADKDTAFFSGDRSQYTTVKNADGTITVTDKVAGRDGTDRLKAVEFAKFKDKSLDLSGPLTEPETPGPGGGGTGGGGTGGGSTGTPGPSLPQPSNLDKVLIGTKKKDALVGGAGDDKLYGLSGNDMLTGGAGQDTFVFNTALGKGTTKKNHNKKVNFDTITDFNPTDDAIWLDNKIFKKLGKAGSEASPAKLNAKFFKIGRATDKNVYLTYKNGVVYYDKDAVGTKYKPVQIMKFADKPVLTAEDFFVI